MVIVRRGKLRDCSDLLTVYQGTHWDEGYVTVEQVKDVHRSPLLQKWGWLVAELDSTVVAEILFGIERNESAGKVGIIYDIGVDVRLQRKMGIGKQLVHKAEETLRRKGVKRVIALSPTHAYNFWMKLKYFQRGKYKMLSGNPKDFPVFRTPVVQTKEVDISETGFPSIMKFSNIGIPGGLAETASKVINVGYRGRIFEFFHGDSLIGMGAIAANGTDTCHFSVEVTQEGMEFSDVVISRVARASNRLGISRISTIVPTESIERFSGLVSWEFEDVVDIPVVKFL